MTSCSSVVAQVATANATIVVVASIVKPAACAAAISAISISGRSTNGGSSASATVVASAPARRACSRACRTAAPRRRDRAAGRCGGRATARARAPRSRRGSRSPSPAANTIQRLPTRKPRSRSSSPALGVFRNEALRGDRQAEVDDVADQQHPGPDVDVDAEFEAAHPAGEQDLRQEDDGRARRPGWRRPFPPCAGRRRARSRARPARARAGETTGRRAGRSLDFGQGHAPARRATD